MKMTEIKHHLNDQLLIGYSAGSLPEAFSLIVATHISLCDECRARLAEFDAVGGQVMMQSQTAEMSEDGLAETLARIAGGAQAPAPTARRSGVFPRPLQDYVQGDVEAVKWKRVGGGVRQMILSTDGQATARLLYIPAGVAVPDHGHRGTELTLVLQGAFEDETDHFGRDDIEIADEDLNHQPVAAHGADCICLAVTDAPLGFSGIIPRIAQRFMQI